MLIALRVMVQKEALDFEQDPRGIIPEGLDLDINDIVSKQLQFIIGHEL